MINFFFIKRVENPKWLCTQVRPRGRQNYYENRKMHTDMYMRATNTMYYRSDMTLVHTHIHTYNKSYIQ